MKNLVVHVVLAAVVAGAWASDAMAQATPTFSMKIVKIFDSDFVRKTCGSCGPTGTTELALGTIDPGDTVEIRAFAFGWDEVTIEGVCTTGGPCRTDVVDSCSSKHCTDTDSPCSGDGQCNEGASCVLDRCNFDPAVGSFQWTVDTASLSNNGPGLITLAERPCDVDLCFDCLEDSLTESGPGGACGLCSCLNGVSFPCDGNCTCCPAEVCPADTGVCLEKSTAFIDLSRSDWILDGTAPTISVFPEAFEWIGAINGRVGAAQGDDPSYMGSVLLTLPDCGGGVYNVNFFDDPDRSFLNDADAIKLPLPILEGVTINLPAVADPCDGFVCNDNVNCTDDACNNDSCAAVCEFSPTVCSFGFACDESTGNCVDVRGACCPADEAADCEVVAESTCDGSGGSFKGAGTDCGDGSICDSAGNNCTTLAADFPPNCAVDARQPSTIDGVTPQGWDRIDVAVGPSGCILDAGQLAVDVVPSGAPLGISSVSQAGGIATITFDAIIPSRNWTCVSLLSNASQEACLGNLPGDVNSDGTANPALDLGAEIDCINNPGTCDPWQENIDRTGAGAGVLDITRVIDLFNGAGAYESFTGASFAGNSCPSQ